MNILLIRPWVNKKITTVKNFLFGEPLGIECVAAILEEQGHQVLLADFMVEEQGSVQEYIQYFEPDVVGITSQCTDVENVLKIAAIVQGEARAAKRKMTVIVGGVQATVYPNSFFHPDVDHVFKSTTRQNYRELMEHLEKTKGQEKQEVLSEPILGIYSKEMGFENNLEFCFNEYVRPSTQSTQRYRKEYKYVGFQPCAVIQTAFGCRNRCEFCVRWKLEGGNLREVPIEEIVDQIQDLDEPYVMICDNDFLINPKRLARFCDLLEEREIKKEYICYGSVNSILDKVEIFPRLRKNGLVAVIVGYESFDDSQLKAYNKAATVDENLQATEVLKQNQIAIWGSFILHPDWDKEDFRKLNRYKKMIKPDLLTFSPLNPHPLTPLFQQYKDRLIYDEVDYEKWNFGDVLIMPSKMSLKEYYFEVLKFTFGVNLNWHSIKYTFKTFPIKNNLKMIFGFNTLIGVYIQNFRHAREKERSILEKAAKAKEAGDFSKE